ncbi:hypothetical protein [Desulfovibrio litoralis]|nr:hypothetical protein [Desulfovibrio litoralis]
MKDTTKAPQASQGPRQANQPIGFIRDFWSVFPEYLSGESHFEAIAQ